MLGTSVSDHLSTKTGTDRRGAVAPPPVRTDGRDSPSALWQNRGMFSYQREALDRVVAHLRARFPDRIASVYAFGSRVRGDHATWSDLDILVVVRNRDPALVDEIVGVFVEEELERGLSFSPVVKDETAFDLEKRYHTPFYENVTREGISL